MNLYLITQDTVLGYDTYDSAVVVARTAFAASRIYPGRLDGKLQYIEDVPSPGRLWDDWPTDAKHVTANRFSAPASMPGEEGDND